MKSPLLRSLSVALALTPLLASRATAHAPPEVLQVISSTPEDIVLSTNRGFIFGNRTTNAWSLLCNEAFGVSTSSQYQSAMLESGRILVAEHGGLRFSDDRGCTWERNGELGKLSTPALAQHPETRDRLYLTVYGFDGSDMVTGMGGVRRSDDGGETFRSVYKAPEGEFLNSLLVSSGEPGHVYASVTSFGLSGSEYLVIHSTDGGKTWQRNRVESDVKKEMDVTLLAINPENPQEILARATGSEPALGERLLWSSDGGRTFRSPGTWAVLRSAAFSRDGRTAYVSYREGLLRATTAARTFEKVGISSRISSVVTSDSTLMVSGYYAGEASPLDGLATAPMSDPETKFETYMNFTQVDTHASCPAPSTAEQDCDTLWRDWVREFGLDQPGGGQTPDGGVSVPVDGDDDIVSNDDVVTRDAGRRDGGTSSSGDDDAPAAKSSGCALSAGGHPDASTWLPLSLLALAWRRRHRRASR
ncbi:MAG: exo-alpha-sialidase [Polyangiales bacterium]